MKWGIRRYQNSDGSLTSAGRQRYSGQKVSSSDRAAATKYVMGRRLVSNGVSTAASGNPLAGAGVAIAGAALSKSANKYAENRNGKSSSHRSSHNSSNSSSHRSTPKLAPNAKSIVRSKDVKGTNHKFTEEEALAETQKWMDKHQGEYSFNYTPSKKRNTVGSKLNQLVNRAITKTQSASINGLSNQTIDFGNQAIQANNWAMEQSIRANN